MKDPAQLLEVDAGQLRNAKDSELLKPIRVRFIEEGADRTIDASTKFPKNCTIEGFCAQQTILELRQQIADQEKIAFQDVNLFGPNTAFPDKLLIADCYADWMGFGLEDWPPRFISKPRIRGFEVFVDVPASRDTSVWENGRMQSYHDRQLVFDVSSGTTVSELKAMIAKRINIPAKRQRLTAHLRESLRTSGRYVLLRDEKTMGDYRMEEQCVAIKFEKSQFDENGDYIFDDAYWDDTGYHPQPPGTWIPQDSLCDRSRPDASKVDPTQPLSIVSDRRAAER
mmetsp:Transcript_85672/g.247386  ORF Transcript_85672/g.247386 Transcript_85672/m.247386 type:complete len:283 (+) Transcript_85672:127-975(+)